MKKKSRPKPKRKITDPAGNSRYGAGKLRKISSRPLNKAAQKRYDAAMKRLDRKFKPLVDAIRDSQRITAADLNVMVR